MRSSSPCPQDDPTAALVAAHRPLFLSIIRKLKVPAWARDDAEQGAVLGFMVALRRFDPDRDVPIGVYAREFIKHEILVAVGWHRKSLEMETLGEVALMLLPAEDPPLDSGPVVVELHERDAAIAGFVSGLDRIDQLVLQRLYVDGATQVALADEIGMTPMQLSRRKRHLLAQGREVLDDLAA